jgi:hypothetical protein
MYSERKTGRKWLKRNWSDSDCVRAQDIPYDAASANQTQFKGRITLKRLVAQ